MHVRFSCTIIRLPLFCDFPGATHFEKNYIGAIPTSALKKMRLHSLNKRKINFETATIRERNPDHSLFSFGEFS